MSFSQDCVRALCIAVMAVPVFTLVGLADASAKDTQQTQSASTPTAEVIAAPAQQPSGESASNTFFAPTIPADRPAPLNAAFFEQLFGYDWSAKVGMYELHLAGPEELDQAWPFTTLGTNALGDPFLLTIRSMLKVDLGQLSYEKQDAMSRASVDRAWAVGGDFETELGLVSTVGILLQGSADDGSMWWRVVPGFINNVDGAQLDDNGPFGNAAIVFEVCEDIDAEPGGIYAILVICAVIGAAALIARELHCISGRETCRDVARAERWFAWYLCYGLSGIQRENCLQCIYDRWVIAMDRCDIGCGENVATPGDFSMCY